MIIATKNEVGTNIKITSDEILDFLANIDDYSELTLEMGYNCGANIKKTYFLNNDVSPCNGGENGFWSMDFSYYKTNNIIPIQFKVRDLATGQIHSGSSTTDFVYYNANCPTGCTLESLNPNYSNYIKTDLLNITQNQTKWATATSYVTSFCGDVLRIYDMPAECEPYSVVFANGQEVFYNYNYSGIIISDGIYINKDFMGADLKDGIYTIKIKMKQSNGSTVSDSVCFFFDQNVKCQVSAKIKELIEMEDEAYGDNKSWLDLSAAHWGLTIGSECRGCNCDDLCALWNKFLQILGEPIKIIEKDCGCAKM